MTVRRILAWLRWSKAAVCAESAGRGLHDDFHDYPDSREHDEDNLGPMHEYRYRCTRCGKEFYI